MSFLDLPWEIRHAIYRECLTHNNGSIYPQLKKSIHINAALLRTCRSVYDEAIDVLYGENKFHYVPSGKRGIMVEKFMAASSVTFRDAEFQCLKTFFNRQRNRIFLHRIKHIVICSKPKWDIKDFWNFVHYLSDHSCSDFRCSLDTLHVELPSPCSTIFLIHRIARPIADIDVTMRVDFTWNHNHGPHRLSKTYLFKDLAGQVAKIKGWRCEEIEESAGINNAGEGKWIRECVLRPEIP